MILLTFKNKAEFDKACKALDEAIKTIGTSRFDYGRDPHINRIRILDEKNIDVVEGLLKKHDLTGYEKEEDITSWAPVSAHVLEIGACMGEKSAAMTPWLYKKLRQQETTPKGHQVHKPKKGPGSYQRGKKIELERVATMDMSAWVPAEKEKEVIKFITNKTRTEPEKSPSGELTWASEFGGEIATVRSHGDKSFMTISDKNLMNEIKKEFNPTLTKSQGILTLANIVRATIKKVRGIIATDTTELDAMAETIKEMNDKISDVLRSLHGSVKQIPEKDREDMLKQLNAMNPMMAAAKDSAMELENLQNAVRKIEKGEDYTGNMNSAIKAITEIFRTAKHIKNDIKILIHDLDV